MAVTNHVDRMCAQLLQKQDRRNRFYWNDNRTPRDSGRPNKSPERD